MTTDTKPKLAYEEIIIGNKIIKIAGVAKGSGMISPNLATMLSFIFTDADIQSNLLKSLLKKSSQTTFNAITVDNDHQLMIWLQYFLQKKLKLVKIEV